MLTKQRIYRTTMAIALTGALVAPAANAMPTDSVPAPAASLADDHWTWTKTRDAAPRQDLRSPDTRDAAIGRGTWSVPDVTVVRLPQPSPVVAERGIDWADAGIGAGTLFGVMLVGLGGAMAVVHRRRTAAAA
jgi:hypothetical protein